MGVSPHEHALLEKHNFGFKPLMGERSGNLDWKAVGHLAFAMTVVFLAQATFRSWVLRYDYEWLSLGLAWICAIMSLLWPTITFLVLMFMVLLPAMAHREHRWSGLLYWSLAPTLAFVLLVSSLILGIMLGEYLWKDVHQYLDLSHLRHYGGLNPSKVPGTQVQDVGRLEFGPGAAIDRGHGGCFVNGATYCVAPINIGGTQDNRPQIGTQDYFAVGVGCCDCPVTNFMCGAWNNPFAHGGLRSVDRNNRAYFQMAVEQWSATYNVQAKEPLFFDWVPDAEHEFKMLWSRAMSMYILAVVGFPPVAVTVALLVHIFCATLYVHGILSPHGNPPEPPKFLGFLWRRALPELNKAIEIYDGNKLAPPQVSHHYDAVPPRAASGP